MGYLCLGLVIVLWIGVGVALLVRNGQRKAKGRFDPQAGTGVIVGSIAPLVILFYLLSCIGAPSLAYIVQTAFEEGLSPLAAALLPCFGVFTIALPLLALLLKWRERTVIDAEGIQFPLFPFRQVRLPWSEIDKMEIAVHGRRGGARVYITEVSIRAGGKVYKPTWDRATWQRRKKTILGAIAKRAYLAEVTPGYWLRDVDAEEVERGQETGFCYFEHPHAFSTYTDQAQRCDLCGQERPGYKEPFYGCDASFVCEACLAAGKLADVKGSTNEGDLGSLRGQLQEMHPDWGEEQVQELVQQRTAELEHRTPHLVTWQSFRWPAHCGDYCRFVKEVGKPDLDELAPDGDGQAFFGEHLRERDRRVTDVPDVWQSIRPDSPQDNAASYSVGVYLFRCLHCGECVIAWDSS